MALGRGLSALIVDQKDASQEQGGALLVETALIKDNRLQPRQTYDVVTIEELPLKKRGFCSLLWCARRVQGLR